jgi:hypothetical protein
LTTAGRLLGAWVLVLLCASLVSAAPRARRHAKPAASRCSVTLTLHALLHQPTSGGPLARRHFRIHQGLPHTTTLLQRGSNAGLGDNDAAIQNDAPAASIAADDGAEPELQPLGVLACSVDSLPTSSAFSPRPPRGPPHSI